MQYRTLCQDIACDFKEYDAYVYSLDRRDKLEREVRALKQIDFPAEFVSEPALPLSESEKGMSFRPCGDLLLLGAAATAQVSREAAG